jgi:hypothetical protein
MAGYEWLSADLVDVEATRRLALHVLAGFLDSVGAGDRHTVPADAEHGFPAGENCRGRSDERLRPPRLAGLDDPAAVTKSQKGAAETARPDTPA